MRRTSSRRRGSSWFVSRARSVCAPAVICGCRARDDFTQTAGSPVLVFSEAQNTGDLIMDIIVGAKTLFNRTAVALIIVPLAAAVQAFGISISTLPTGNFSCTTQNGGPTSPCPSGSNVSQLDPIDNISGLEFFGPSSGYSFSNFGSPGTAGVVEFITSGPLSGPSIPSGTIIPVLYDFNVGASGTGNLLDWELLYSIVDNGSVAGVADIFSRNFTGEQSGSAPLQLTEALVSGTIVSLDVNLSVVASGSAFNVNVSIPSGSLDFNNTPAPEPASETLAGLCIAFAGGYRLLRRRRGYVPAKDPTKS